MSSHLLDDDDDLMPRQERELTLSTGSILAVFFGLVLICGLFFAFGYNMGKKASGTTAPITTGDSSDSPESGQFDKFKPAAGSPMNGGTTPANTTNASSPVLAPPQATSETAAPAPTAEPVAEPAVTNKTTTAAATAPPAAAPATPLPAISPSGSFVVQVAAVSHHEDADLLLGALRAKGYPVAIHTEPQDKLLHIQVGPFSTKKDADAMRQRLLNDGYNAIVK